MGILLIISAPYIAQYHIKIYTYLLHMLMLWQTFFFLFFFFYRCQAMILFCLLYTRVPPRLSEHTATLCRARNMLPSIGLYFNNIPIYIYNIYRLCLKCAPRRFSIMNTASDCWSAYVTNVNNIRQRHKPIDICIYACNSTVPRIPRANISVYVKTTYMVYLQQSALWCLYI